MEICRWISRISAANLFLMAYGCANETASIYQMEVDSVVTAEVDYLLWFSNQNGLHSPTVVTGESPNLSADWSSGIRAAITGQPTHWDIELCYTYYSTNSNDTVNANIEAILTSTPSTAGIFEVGQWWNLTFNRLDLQLGRKLLFGHHFLLEPFFGVEGLNVSQKFDLNINTAFLDLTTGLPATNLADSKNKNSLLGIGPRMGFRANLDFKAGFGLYCNLGMNFLWGHFKIAQNYSQKNSYSSSPTTVLVDQDRNLSQGGSILNSDLEIGFNWRRLFKNLELVLKAGWEQHYYIDIVRFQDFYLQQTSLGTAAYTTNGNLALSGLSISIMLRH